VRQHMQRIKDEFHGSGTIRGGLLLLRPNDALRLVQRCCEQDIKVLGVDGFILTACTTQPSMEQSIDLSDLEGIRNPVNCWERAEVFLKERETTDLFFEVVLDERQ
ncbi:MAG: hypothetical protein ACRD2G_09495, partial [Terriglobia bacterium]